MIGLIPEARELLGIEITCNEGGLPTARRSRDPDHGPLPQSVQLAKEPHPGKNACEDWAGYLTQGSFTISHSLLSERRGDYIFQLFLNSFKPQLVTYIVMAIVYKNWMKWSMINEEIVAEEFSLLKEEALR